MRLKEQETVRNAGQSYHGTATIDLLLQVGGETPSFSPRELKDRCGAISEAKVLPSLRSRSGEEMWTIDKAPFAAIASEDLSKPDSELSR